MEPMQRESVTPNRPLRREAVLPTSAGPSRPCMLVGLSLVALCLAASLDAFLWHQSRDQEDAEIRQAELREQTQAMAMELVATREALAVERLTAKTAAEQLAAMQKDMKAAQHALDMADTEAGRVNARQRLRDMKRRWRDGTRDVDRQIRELKRFCIELKMKCERFEVVR